MVDPAAPERLAAQLLRSKEDALQARAELTAAPRAVSDRVARLLAAELRAGKVQPVIRALDAVGPVWFERSRVRLLLALRDKLAMGHTVMRAYTAIANQTSRHDPGGTATRLASVFTRAWVIAVFAPILLLGTIFLFTGPSRLRIATAIVLAACVPLALGIDAWLRRCPTCRRFLAGVDTGLRQTGSDTHSVVVTTPTGSAHIDQTHSSYAQRWRCAHCAHTWER